MDLIYNEFLYSLARQIAFIIANSFGLDTIEMRWCAYETKCKSVSIAYECFVVNSWKAVKMMYLGNIKSKKVTHQQYVHVHLSFIFHELEKWLRKRQTTSENAAPSTFISWLMKLSSECNIIFLMLHARFPDIR